MDCCCGGAFGTLNLFAFLVAFIAIVRSASRFSNVPKSVLPLSSSDSNPDSRRRDSMRPRRFSNPSIYLALQGPSVRFKVIFSKKPMHYLPFGRVTLLLNLREDTICLVVNAVRALRHLAVAFDLFLSTHVASLSCETQKDISTSARHNFDIDREVIPSQFVFVWRRLNPPPRLTPSHQDRSTPRRHRAFVSHRESRW